VDSERVELLSSTSSTSIGAASLVASAVRLPEALEYFPCRMEGVEGGAEPSVRVEGAGGSPAEFTRPASTVGERRSKGGGGGGDCSRGIGNSWSRDVFVGMMAPVIECITDSSILRRTSWMDLCVTWLHVFAKLLALERTRQPAVRYANSPAKTPQLLPSVCLGTDTVPT